MKLKLTLRDLFWLTLVVAVCCAWWTHHRLMNSELEITRNAAKKVVITEIWLRRLGYSVDPTGALHKVK